MSSFPNSFTHGLSTCRFFCYIRISINKPRTQCPPHPSLWRAASSTQGEKWLGEMIGLASVKSRVWVSRIPVLFLCCQNPALGSVHCGKPQVSLFIILFPSLPQMDFHKLALSQKNVPKSLHISVQFWSSMN